MADKDNPETKITLGLSKQIDLKKNPESGQVRQSFSHGRSKTVTVEVKKKRFVSQTDAGAPQPADRADSAQSQGRLTNKEWDTRLKALQTARKAETEDTFVESEELHEEKQVKVGTPVYDTAKPAAAPIDAEITEPLVEKPKSTATQHARHGSLPKTIREDDEEDEERNNRSPSVEQKRVAPVTRRDEKRRPSKVSINSLDDDGEEKTRTRSLASMRRAKEKFKNRLQHDDPSAQKIIREVIVPETISVQDLANRMATRGADVVKSLIRMGMMVTINQFIDADTAEIIITEYGHKIKRVSDADVEFGIKGEEDNPQDLRPRAPVVTIMGHVDHGKTSLLDALRKTDVVSSEAGGITQHIGAYQVTMSSGKKITFIDTPGHAAFTEMRARGANVTDVVVLVVAADDGIKEQTIEAIRHAKAAKVPIVVAINKVDKPDAQPDRVRMELLQHEIVVEKLGGDVLDVEVSAKTSINLEKLEEAILLQSEILDLNANPSRPAEGIIIEAKMERGRGAVATVLVQKGSLKIGDIFIAGNEWGRVRALVDERGNKKDRAGPSVPVEVVGLTGVPLAGDDFIVLGDETKARQIADYRKQRQREHLAASRGRGTMEQMMSQIAAGETKELPVLVKSDVQGSLEAIIGSLEKITGSNEVSVRILHAAVGGINESDVTLASASNAIIVGFNVRANPQARDLAKRDEVDIRYYSIIYNVIDDIKAALSGLLSPIMKEKFLGYASIRDVFNITKIGKVAGCMITEGIVKRGAKVRLLRDNVVIHEGSLKTLKRFKDEVKEVKDGFECGMAFENYHDIRAGDVIECFEIEEIARTLE
ncbi:MAG: translation initiation factor IF-2 [Alphaproteobacteria bacterium]|nr:translation initiation factor IF-2 [Alphaproteobacteria bacterium]